MALNDDEELNVPVHFDGMDEAVRNAEAFERCMHGAAESSERITRQMRRHGNINPSQVFQSLGYTPYGGGPLSAQSAAIGFNVRPMNLGGIGNIGMESLMSRLHPGMSAAGESATRAAAESTSRLDNAFRTLSNTTETVSGGIKNFSDELGKAMPNLKSVGKTAMWHLGNALGVKPPDPNGPNGTESFAKTLGRFMAARNLVGLANVGFEHAKNPLHDNFRINTAQKAANSAVNVLATTGSPLQAAIAGLTSVMMSNIQRRNQIHTETFQFNESSANIRRNAEQQKSDWSFQQVLSRFSRPERLRMMQAREDHIRGRVTEISKAEDIKYAERQVAYHQDRAAKVLGIKVPGADNLYEKNWARQSTRNAASRNEKTAEELAEEKARQTIHLPGQDNIAKARRTLNAYAGGLENNKYGEAGFEGLVDFANKQLEKELGEKVDVSKLSKGTLSALRESLRKADESYSPEGLPYIHTHEHYYDAMQMLRGKKTAEEEPPKEQKDAESDGKSKGIAAALPVFKPIAQFYGDWQSIAGGKKDGVEKRGAEKGGAQSSVSAAASAASEASAKATEASTSATAKAVDGKQSKSVWNERAKKEAEANTRRQKDAENIEFQMVSNASPTTQKGLEAKKAWESAVDVLDSYKNLQVGQSYGKFNKEYRDKRAVHKGALKDTLRTHGAYEAVGKKVGDVLTEGDLSKAIEMAERGEGLYAKMTQGRRDEATTYLKNSLAESRRFNGEDFVKYVEQGKFKDTDLESLSTAMKMFEDAGQNTDNNAAYKRIKDMYLTQEQRAEELSVQQFKERYDPSQIMHQYTDASRVNDSMSRQGFFIGAQVDVQDVNRDILAELKKLLTVVEKQSREGVENTKVNFARASWE